MRGKIAPPSQHKPMKLARLFWVPVLALALAGPAPAQLIDVRQFSVEPAEEGYVVNANFEFILTPRLEEALNNGVVLSFVIEFELIRPRWYWFDEKTAGERLEVRLSFNTLLRQYRVSTGPVHRNFSSLADALNMVSRLRSWPVFERERVRPDVPYIAGLRMRLDPGQLPKPFQLSAITDRELTLASEWRRVPFTPAAARSVQ
jgi:hypothetical protein